MASTSQFLNPFPPLSHRPSPPPSPFSPHSATVCGPRDNRGPLVRGRTLSTEAILAVQSLKRSQIPTSQNPQTLPLLSKTLSRLLKSDLLAALTELQRQGHPRLALHVFAFARAEPWFQADCALYADMLKSLANGEMGDEVDELVRDLVEELEREGGIKGNDLRGPARLVKALVAAGKGEGVREVYGLMKRGGCVPNEYLFKLLMRGLVRLGEEAAAKEVERDYQVWFEGGVWSEPMPV